MNLFPIWYKPYLGLKEKRIFLAHLVKPVAEFRVNAYSTIVSKHFAAYCLAILGDQHLPWNSLRLKIKVYHRSSSTLTAYFYTIFKCFTNASFSILPPQPKLRLRSLPVPSGRMAIPGMASFHSGMFRRMWSMTVEIVPSPPATRILRFSTFKKSVSLLSPSSSRSMTWSGLS